MNNYKTYQSSTIDRADAGLRNYFLGIYWRMSLGILWTGLLIFGTMQIPALLNFSARFSWLFLIAALGIGMTAPYVIQRKSVQTGQLVFWLYASVLGIAIAPIIAMYVSAGATVLVAQAFFMAAGMFAATSIYGYVTKRSLMGLSAFMSFAFWGVLIAIVVNIFLKSSLFAFGISIFLVLYYAGITAWQTQMLKNLYYTLPADGRAKMAIMGALVLYAAFVGFFLSILQILGFAARR